MKPKNAFDFASLKQSIQFNRPAESPRGMAIQMPVHASLVLNHMFGRTRNRQSRSQQKVKLDAHDQKVDIFVMCKRLAYRTIIQKKFRISHHISGMPKRDRESILAAPLTLTIPSILSESPQPRARSASIQDLSLDTSQSHNLSRNTLLWEHSDDLSLSINSSCHSDSSNDNSDKRAWIKPFKFVVRRMKSLKIEISAEDN
jgi:hypothetical protein